ncbi:MAG: arylsulfatase [Parvibaculum sp.]
MGQRSRELSATLGLACGLLAGSVSAAHADTRPNIVVLLVDDAGLMDFEPFGGEARMPNVSRLAAQGTRFSGYHTSPLCAPSRAMLLTGVDNHRTGIATIPEVLPAEHEDAPGYSMSFEPGVETLADRLQREGYRTLMTGKWHLGSDEGDLPNHHGFDRSFALDASGADNWEQRSYMPYYATAPWFEDGKPADLPEDFYSSKFMVDQMITYLDEEKEQPFFAYVAFQAIHIPVQAPREFTDNYIGVYDAGWHKLREDRWQRAKALGLIPAHAPLAPMPPNTRDWDGLTEEQRTYYARAMSVNAGMLEAMDFHIGRLMDHLAARGELENTIFIVTSDNGPEPSDLTRTRGTDLWMAMSGYNMDIETLGEKGSLVSIGSEWANAAAAPGNLFKFYATEGGIRVPLIISGPGVPSGKMVSSLSFVTDIAPTLMDLVGVTSDGDEPVDMTGRSLMPVLTGTAAETHPVDQAVGMEVAGNSALFKNGYKLTRNTPPYGDNVWRLYDLARDPGEVTDLKEGEPARFAQMMADYDAYAAEFGVQTMPAGFDHLKQIRTNTLKKLFAANHAYIIGALLLIMAGLFFALRAIWRLVRPVG